MKDRRTKEGYKLRVYIDEIRLVKSMTNLQWIDQWAQHADKNSEYISQDNWIAYLDECIMVELDRYFRKVAA